MRTKAIILSLVLSATAFAFELNNPVWLASLNSFPPDRGTHYRWKFNGNLIESSTGLPATNYGCTFADGALVRTENQYVELPAALTINWHTPWSVTDWVKGTGANDSFLIGLSTMDSDGTVNCGGFYLDSTAISYFGYPAQRASQQCVSEARIQTTLNAADGQWHNRAWVYDGNKVAVFIDGVYQGEQSGLTFSPTLTHNFISWNDARDIMNCSLDDMNYFGYALTTNEVRQIYSGGRK